MFYNSKPGNELRFGDVLEGFLLYTPTINSPIKEMKGSYTIDIEMPQHCVILTPCCSIKDGFITITPLQRIKKDILNNENFIQKPELLNYEIEPSLARSKKDLESLDQNNLEEYLSQPKAYSHYECFLYPGHDLLPVYMEKTKEGVVNTNAYMIDFRCTYRINNKYITRKNRILENSKVLELSISARDSLRNKMAHFFGRVPDEDAV